MLHTQGVLSSLLDLAQTTTTDTSQDGAPPGTGDLSFLDWVGLSGWVIGLAGLLITYVAWRGQTRTSGAFTQLLEEADRDRKVLSTQEELEQLELQRGRLYQALREDIPREATRVFMVDRTRELARSITLQYNEYVELRDRLTAMDSTGKELPPEVARAVVETIRPRYLAQQQQRQRGLVLVAIGMLAVTFPFLVDYATYFIELWLGEVPFTGTDALVFVTMALISALVGERLGRRLALMRRPTVRTRLLAILPAIGAVVTLVAAIAVAADSFQAAFILDAASILCIGATSALYFAGSPARFS